MLRLIRDRLQVDRPLAFALATRTWHAFSGPITIILLIRSLTLPEQGVYYAIVGIIGIQAYFELGLLNVLVSHSSHEAAALNQAVESEASGGAEADSTATARATARMRDLIRSSTRWFGVASLFYVVAAVAFGWYTLSDSEVDWRGPLLALAPLAALTVALAPALSILEGAGSRDLIYRSRFVQKSAGSFAVWFALLMGWKLWSLVASVSVQAAVAAYIVFITKRPFFAKFRQASAEASDFSWIHEVLPVQWRVALISATFHFATQFFAIIVLIFHGDAEAGPIGMTLSATGAIQMLALAWVQTKYPLVSAHHGAGERHKAGTIWRHTAVVSTSLLIAACSAFTLLVACLPWLESGVERRFIAPWQLIVMSVGFVALHVVNLQGFYVLSRRAPPLLAASLLGSLTAAAAVWIGGYFYSTSGVVIGYALSVVLVLLPAHSYAYYRFRERTDV